MSREEIEPKLAKLMSDIAEVEGIFAIDMNGNLIAGQTIQQDMDKEAIKAKISDIINTVNQLGDLIGKGSSTELKIDLETGIVDIVIGNNLIIGAFIDQESKSQLGLISRSIKNILGI